ncbi:unnamed protein product [Caenorhabditis angaria]|uniref:Protein N-terminal glutamine amidohydrolase n=1 Tax=Caenorhabditis angaria TaxID=860376 RepID=A0A9P1I4S4_9PELO|nr:unnamed protein product [Caenorhabditis angaria]
MKKEEFPYKSCYCEENIYKFLEILKNDSFYAVLISNKNQQIPLWKQKIKQGLCCLGLSCNCNWKWKCL